MSDNLDIRYILTLVFTFLVSLTVHEYAHARSALAAGDDTAKLQGRVSLNPLVHLDPMGTLMFLFMLMGGIGLAWGKPVPVNPFRFRSPRWDNLKVSLWGPLSNLILAVIAGLFFRFVVVRYAPEYIELAWLFVRINVGLAMFNLLPIPPLDGSHIFSSLLPIESARKFDRTIGQYGMVILILMILPIFDGTSAIRLVIGTPINIITRFLTGVG